MSEIYTISGDFEGTEPNTEQLSAEIEADSINITTALVGIGTEYDNVTIVFSSSISGSEKTALDTIVANHVPNTDPTPNAVFPVIPRVSTVKKNKYQRIATFEFPGSTFAIAKSISRMASGMDSYDIRIIDKTNGQVLLTKNLTNTEESTQELGTLSNLSPNKATLQIFAKRNGGTSSKRVYIENINIEYVSNR